MKTFFIGTTCNKQKQGFKLNGRRIQNNRSSFCTPYPDADLSPSSGFTTGQKTVENQDWATGPTDRRRPAFSKTHLGHHKLNTECENICSKNKSFYYFFC